MAREGWQGKDGEERKERMARYGKRGKDSEERKDFLIRS